MELVILAEKKLALSIVGLTSLSPYASLGKPDYIYTYNDGKIVELVWKKVLSKLANTIEDARIERRMSASSKISKEYVLGNNAFTSLFEILESGISAISLDHECLFSRTSGSYHLNELEGNVFFTFCGFGQLDSYRAISHKCDRSCFTCGEWGPEFINWTDCRGCPMDSRLRNVPIEVRQKMEAVKAKKE